MPQRFRRPERTTSQTLAGKSFCTGVCWGRYPISVGLKPSAVTISRPMFFQAQKRFHQCAFSCAVFTDDSKVVPFIDGEIQVGKNRFSIIRYGKMAACKQTHQLSASLRTFTLWFMRSI